MSIVNTYDFLKNVPHSDNTYVVLVRHGESEVNAQNKVGGCSPLADLPLTEKGENQAREVGEKLAPFLEAVSNAYTSPMQRAQQTAAHALWTMGLGVRPRIDDRLKEKFYGEALDGQSEEVYNQFATVEREAIREMSFAEKWTYTVVEDAESFEQIWGRIRPFLLDMAKKHPGEVVLAFGHKVSCIKVPTMGALKEQGVEIDFRDPLFDAPKNGSTIVLEVNAEQKQVRLVAVDGFSFSALEQLAIKV